MSDQVSQERFRGDLEGWLAWAADHWRPGSGGCARHWAPAPVEGANGVVASVLLFQAGVELAPRAARRAKGRKAAAMMNGWLASLDEPLCCMLGDERVAEIWREAGAA